MDTPTTLFQSMRMDHQVQSINGITSDLGLDIGWNLDAYIKIDTMSASKPNATGAVLQGVLKDSKESVSFADSVPSLTYFEPFASEYVPIHDTTNPTNLWPASRDNQYIPTWQSLAQTNGRSSVQQSAATSSPSGCTSRLSICSRPPSCTPPSMISDGQTLSTQVSTPTSMRNGSAIAPQAGESEMTRRARYAANQRHNKAQQARKDSHHNRGVSEADSRAAERKRRHREKNKAAAAKCRTRQRKQVQIIQERGTRLGEKNLELKIMVQELRNELNGLRLMALDHQQCNCHVARYNHSQAERVVAEYRSSCLRHRFGGVASPLDQHGVQPQ